MSDPPLIRSCFAAFLLTAAALHAQSEPGPFAVRASVAGDPASIVRDIPDPFCGARWTLVRDPDYPGGPGRLIRTDLSNRPTGIREAGPNPLAIIIRAGDRLTLEAHTGTADTWLDAVALGPARLGASFLARLTFDNCIVRVLATAKGRATLAATNDQSNGWTK